jgi:hypothetical protein
MCREANAPGVQKCQVIFDRALRSRKFSNHNASKEIAKARNFFFASLLKNLFALHPKGTSCGAYMELFT